jgi:hypothetical protein
MSATVRRGTGLVLAGLLFYTLFLVTTLPAHWLGELLARGTNGALRLQNTHGSLWQGSGLLTVHSGGGGRFSTPLHWEIHPLWLLTGRLRADVQTEGEHRLRARVAIGYRQLQLDAVEAELSAALIPALYPPAALIAPTGSLQLKAEQLSLDRRGLAGEARLTWLGAGGRLGGIGEVGDFLLVVNGQDGVATLRAETLRGELQLDAHGRWQPAGDGTLQLEGTLAAGSARAATLAPMLAMLNARPDGDRHSFRYNTRIPLPAMLGGQP